MVSRTVPAPAGLGVYLLGVLAGVPVTLALRLEAVLEGVLVSGTARAPTTGECARCLRVLDDEIEVDLQELYAYPESDAEDDEAGRVHDDAIDLEPLLRDAVVLALPFRPLCSQDCAGLCPSCGARLDEDPGHAHPQEPDPRWSALSALLPHGRRGSDDDRPGRVPGRDEE